MATSDALTDQAALYFDVCARIEGCCAELYHYYSEIFQDSEDVASMWKNTALEEEGHQKQFEMANKIIRDVSFELNADMERATRVYQKLNNLLEHVRMYPPEITVALSKAIDMEESLADLHLDSSVHFQDDSINKMFLAMRGFDKDHIAAMRRCLTILQLADTEMAG